MASATADYFININVVTVFYINGAQYPISFPFVCRIEGKKKHLIDHVKFFNCTNFCSKNSILWELYAQKNTYKVRCIHHDKRLYCDEPAEETDVIRHTFLS